MDTSRVDGVKAPHNETPRSHHDVLMLIDVTLLSVFLRATLIFLLGVRAWTVAASSAGAVNRTIFAFKWSLQLFLCLSAEG